MWPPATWPGKTQGISTDLVDEGREVDVVYLDFTKAFDTVSCNILIHKLMKYRLDKWPVRWIENWLNCNAQSIVVSGTKSLWTLVPCDAHQGVDLGPVLFNFFINDLNDGTECTLGKRNHNRLDKWANRDFMKFNKGKCKVLHLGKNNPKHPYRMGSHQLEISFAEKALQGEEVSSWTPS
ncbi:hypothetical protein QYF61_009217 [Mycteria americana]|uniref:Reverse transcriptase domain-containing protein n=1 Tax=Mycteria americana TaxID=33587 RepID=A0AAN7NQH1_MYCAM|nr:hypothetical protein QYF61_009217 [Mycteria americana]